MSEFSERCRQLLINSGSNVYQMAKYSSLDKTSIQRMVTGKRLPSLDFVKKFCSYLRISPIEKKELLELYEIEKVGKSEYMSRCYIKSLIENISFLDEDDTENISFSETLEYCETFPPMPNVESKILFVLQSELKNDKNPEILFNLPTSYRYIFFILKGLFAEFEGEASVKHLITLNKNPLNTIYPCQNLEALSNILPLSEILKNVYLPYYLYNNLTLGDEKMLIMPYYIITSKYLPTISSDFKTVSLHDSDTVIRVYRKEFYRIFNMAQPLIKYADNTFKIINHLQENYIEYGLPSHTLEFHPCLFFMDTSFALSKESFKQIPHADEHIAALQEMYKVVSASTPPKKNRGTTISFFSEQGLEMFCQTGKCFGQYKNLEMGFSPEERKVMLKSYFRNRDAEAFIPYILKPSFHTPTYLNIELHESHTVTIFSLKENFQFSFIQINESSICNAFFSFFTYLAESDYVYTAKESENILDNYFHSLL